MTGGNHSKPPVKKALREAEDAGLIVKANPGRSAHGWGAIYCTVCGQRFAVWSTPRNADNHAKQIRRFQKRHRHEDEEE